MDRAALVDYIRRAAEMRGIDPDVAVKVAEAEGLNANPEEGWQSQVVKNGKREESYGPFQLYMGGGLGNVFQEQTGFDPRDPTTVAAQVDFALDEALKTGWGPWYGARRVGLSNRSGLPPAPGTASSATASEELIEGSAGPETFFGMFGDTFATPEARATADQRLASESLSAQKEIQAANKSPLDGLGEALQYADLSKLAGAPRYRFDPPGIRRGTAKPGSRALKRLGIASLG